MGRGPILALGLILAAPALAQQQDPIEVGIARQWEAAQTGQQNVAEAITKLVEDRRKLKATLDAERQYWADYVKGLSAGP